MFLIFIFIFLIGIYLNILNINITIQIVNYWIPKYKIYLWGILCAWKINKNIMS